MVKISSLVFGLKMHGLSKIYHLLEDGTITYDSAKELAEPYMHKLNLDGAKQARKQGYSYTPVTFDTFLEMFREEEQKHPHKK